MSTIVLSIQLGLVLLGAVGIIIGSYLIGPSIPYVSGFLGELYGSLGLKALGTTTAHYTEADEYEFRTADRSNWPPELWNRLSGVLFAVSYEATERAFGDTLLDRREQGDPAEMVDDGPQKDTADVGIDREGVKTYARTDADHGWEGLVVKAGEYFEKFSDTAGFDIVAETESAAYEDEGGDTGDHPAKVKLVGVFVFTVLGLALGWIWFL